MKNYLGNGKPTLPKMPFMAKHVYGIAALFVVVTIFPIFSILFNFYEKSVIFLVRCGLLSKVINPPIEILFVIALVVSFSPSYFLGSMLSSKWLVKMVKYFYSQKNDHIASEMLRIYANVLWYKHLKKDLLLQNFILEKKLHEKSKRLRKFMKRLGYLNSE